ncbi:uncharacterized protein LOC112094407 [Morus notabilis]|uniref:uncharacterized protein LOC112094407 n=1 Tax=Morus notabilis TaxID=981085 RepID=UPI000CED5162|nr:uncharacterized protein LOC112094407 [Morus notabilis]
MASRNNSSSSTKTTISRTLVDEVTESAQGEGRFGSILGRFWSILVGSRGKVGSWSVRVDSWSVLVILYNTDELPGIGQLRMIMDPMKEYFPVKVTMKSKIEALEVIRQNLDPETKMPIFKESAFGHLISMSESMIYFGVLTHYLLLRQIEIEKKYELWFMVNGKPTRFGMREFALITGLNCGKIPESYVVLKASNNIRLLEYFKAHVVLVADLKKLFTKNKIKGSDKAKIAIIYFLAQVLLSEDEKKTVPLDWLSYVDDLEFFNSYPWDRVSFECTLRSLKKNLKEKFQKWVWAIKTFPTIGATFAKMIDGRLPRILKWEARRVSLVEVRQIDDLMQSGEEMNSMCMRLYLPYADQEDAEIDEVVSFLDPSARMVHVQQPKPPKQLARLQQLSQQQQMVEYNGRHFEVINKRLDSLDQSVREIKDTIACLAKQQLQPQPEPEAQLEPQVQPEHEAQLEPQVHSELESESK